MSDIRVPSLGMGLMGEGPPDLVTEDHWRAASQGSFTVPTCDACATMYWPVVHACYRCGSSAWSWRPVPGTGHVYTYTWCDQPTRATGEVDNVVVVELDGVPGDPVRVPGWVAGVTREDLVCGLAVRVDFEPVADDIAVPYWRPRPAALTEERDS